MKKPILETQDLSKQFSTSMTIGPIDLHINQGEFLTLLGPSGCGKTTLLRMIAGFEKQDEGTILIDNQSVSDMPTEARPVHTVFQNYALFPHMSVFDNIAFGLKCRGTSKKVIHDKVMAILDKVQLNELKDHKPNQLSGGQQQRVAIARACVNEPKILLLDEPLSALDFNLRKNMRRKLKTLQRSLGITFIMVTHDQEEALSMSDRIAVMHEGKIEQIGTPKAIYETPVNLRVARFIGDTNIFRCPIINSDDNSLTVSIIDKTFTYPNSKHYKTGDFVNIVTRPEDFDVWGKNELEDTSNTLTGIVEEIVYNGSTVDLWVKLANNQTIHATEFFDEQDENLEYVLGESVLVKWKSDWGVVLPDE